MQIIRVSEPAVMAALATVIEPELHRDLVSLNMIRNLKIEGNDVSFYHYADNTCLSSEGQDGGDSRAALAQVPGIGKVTVNWDSNVPTDARIGNQVGQIFP